MISFTFCYMLSAWISGTSRNCELTSRASIFGEFDACTRGSVVRCLCLATATRKQTGITVRCAPRFELRKEGLRKCHIQATGDNKDMCEQQMNVQYQRRGRAMHVTQVVSGGLGGTCANCRSRGQDVYRGTRISLCQQHRFLDDTRNHRVDIQYCQQPSALSIIKRRTGLSYLMLHFLVSRYQQATKHLLPSFT